MSLAYIFFLFFMYKWLTLADDLDDELLDEEPPSDEPPPAGARAGAHRVGEHLVVDVGKCNLNSL